MVFFALGLMSKNMLVTLPLVLLLLDYWPLNRLSGCSSQLLLRRVAEKIPLLVLTVGSCVATVLVPENATAVKLPFGLRLENAVVSGVTYLWQMIHPAGLACFYPNPVNPLPPWEVAGALALLLAISGAAWAFRGKQPWFVVGWLWYLGMLVPVIGIVQISYYGHADRYTYLPQIGLYVLLTWAAADLCAGWRHRRVALGGAAAIILLALIGCARAQTAYWRNGETLWTHALACTPDNGVAHNNLGNALLQKGAVDEAIVQYQMALQIKPDDAAAHYNLGNVLLQMGKVEEAMVQYQQVLAIRPDHLQSLNNLAWLLATCPQASLRNGNQAVALAQRANQLADDGNPFVLCTLAAAYAEAGRYPEAVTTAQHALQVAETQTNTALAGALQSHLKLYQAGSPFHLP